MKNVYKTKTYTRNVCIDTFSRNPGVSMNVIIIQPIIITAHYLLKIGNAFKEENIDIRASRYISTRLQK